MTSADEKADTMPHEEQTYREGVQKDIKALGDKLELRVTTFERDMRDSTQRLELGQAEVIKQVRYTNGKLRKIIIALVLIGGIIIGQAFPTVHDVIQLLGGSISL
jgi:hypothetical protein